MTAHDRVDALFTKLRFLLGDRLDGRLKQLKLDTAVREGDVDSRCGAVCSLVLGKQPEGDPAESLEAAEMRVADWLAMKKAQERLDEMAEAALREREQDMWRELRAQVLREKAGPDTPATLEAYAKLVAQDGISLSQRAFALAHPMQPCELVGQQQAWNGLLGCLQTPHPQHVLLYGPPGVGKTSAARLALRAAIASGLSPFGEGAPFIEADGATMRCDERHAADPLIGSVHDPIYQGARRGLGDAAVPEPRPGMVSEAHGGVLFIDEVGELPLPMQNRLLKVLEEKRVRFQSAYYDPEDPGVPRYIHKLFAEGAPADFVLIGATTRAPHELAPALRSRCVEIAFKPLGNEALRAVLLGAAGRMGLSVTAPAAGKMARAARDGREAVRLVAAAQGAALRMGSPDIGVKVAREAIRIAGLAEEDARGDVRGEAIGRIAALGVLGHRGVVLRLEAAVLQAAAPGSARMGFNEAAGAMARDAVAHAAIALRACGLGDVTGREVYVNATGGGQVDGPSLGLAAALVLLSALEGKPLPGGLGVTGEIGLMGDVLPVGGMDEKIEAARRHGLDTVLVPPGASVPKVKGLRVLPVRTLREALAAIWGV